MIFFGGLKPAIGVNLASNGNGGAIASETDGLSPGSTVGSTVLNVSRVCLRDWYGR